MLKSCDEIDPRDVDLVMLLQRLLLLGAIPLFLVACGGDQDPADQQVAEGVDVFQMFRPERPYGKEGSAAGVLLVRDGSVEASLEPVRSRSNPSLTPQDLGRLAVEAGQFQVLAFQKDCNAKCPATNPSLSRAKNLDISCTERIDTREDSGVFIYVNPTTRRCVVSPLQGPPQIECSTEDPLVAEVVDSYPAIDWDLPSRVCVVDLGDGRILDVFYNGGWGAMRRDLVGVIGDQ